jgi:mannose-6-phosphate isomerase-like protein (cupin superfamily)
VKHFVSIEEVSPLVRSGEHGGIGFIAFRRMLTKVDFAAPIDFVDYTIIPPKSTIGRHEHEGNEELYFVASGSPIVRVQGVERRAEVGSVAVVRSGEWHELINDSEEPVAIFVVQVSQ